MNVAKAEKILQMVHGESLNTNKGQSAASKRRKNMVKYDDFICKLKEKAIQHGYNFLIIPYTEYKNIDNLLVQRLSIMEQGMESPEYKSTVTLLDDGEDIV